MNLEKFGVASAQKFMTLQAEVAIMKTHIIDISSRINSLSNKINSLSNTVQSQYAGFNNELDKFKSEWVSYAKAHPLPDDLVSRVSEIEKMQKYYQHSHGKALNDINDIKKELYGLYAHNIIAPSPEELSESITVDDNDEKIIDIYSKRFDYAPSEKGAFVRMLKANDIFTLGDLRRIPYDELGELNRVGPKNLAILQCIYEEYCMEEK